MSTAKLDEATIAHTAYLFWLDEGQPHGRDQEHWLKAIDALTPATPKKTRKAAAKPAAAKSKAAPKAKAAAPKATKAKAAAPKKAAAKKTAAAK